jgi:hypothetical protein
MNIKIRAGATFAACLLSSCLLSSLSLAFQDAAAQGTATPRPPQLSSEELAKQPQTPGATGDQERHYYFAEAKVESPYHLYVPKKYDGKTKMPLILASSGPRMERLTCSKNTDSFSLRRSATANLAHTEPCSRRGCLRWSIPA